MAENFPEKDAGGHPFWSGSIVGFLGGIEMGLIPREQSASIANSLIHDLLKQGMLKNYGELEKYARERNLGLYVAAMPIEDFGPIENATCRDPFTGEPRPYALNVLVGQPHPEDQNGQRVYELSTTDQETNIARLTNQTGVFMIES